MCHPAAGKVNVETVMHDLLQSSKLFRLILLIQLILPGSLSVIYQHI